MSRIHSLDLFSNFSSFRSELHIALLVLCWGNCAVSDPSVMYRSHLQSHAHISLPVQLYLRSENHKTTCPEAFGPGNCFSDVVLGLNYQHFYSWLIEPTSQTEVAAVPLACRRRSFEELVSDLNYIHKQLCLMTRGGRCQAPTGPAGRPSRGHRAANHGGRILGPDGKRPSEMVRQAGHGQFVRLINCTV